MPWGVQGLGPWGHSHHWFMAWQSHQSHHRAATYGDGCWTCAPLPGVSPAQCSPLTFPSDGGSIFFSWGSAGGWGVYGELATLCDLEAPTGEALVTGARAGHPWVPLPRPPGQAWDSDTHPAQQDRAPWGTLDRVCSLWMGRGGAGRCAQALPLAGSPVIPSWQGWPCWHGPPAPWCTQLPDAMAVLGQPPCTRQVPSPALVLQDPPSCAALSRGTQPEPPLEQVSWLHKASIPAAAMPLSDGAHPPAASLGAQQRTLPCPPGPLVPTHPPARAFTSPGGDKGCPEIPASYF